MNKWHKIRRFYRANDNLYLYFPISLIFKIPRMFYYLYLKDKISADIFNEKVEKLTGVWAKNIIAMTGSKVHITGLDLIPNDTPVLFVSNHQSNFDIAVLIAYINKPKGFIAKVELLKIPLLRTWMKLLSCLFLDRSDMKKSALTITQGIKYLKNGYSLVVFPEGTRSKDGKLSEFKAGSFKLATKSQVPIVPVTINNTSKIMEANKNKIRPSDVYVTIHPKVPTKDLTKEEQNLLPEQIKNIIEASLKV